MNESSFCSTMKLANLICSPASLSKGEAMQPIYTEQRGYHHWVCQLCGESHKELIPDQADDRYQNNPANPWLAVCGSCDGGSPTAAIMLGNSSIPTSRNGYHSEQEQTHKPGR